MPVRLVCARRAVADVVRDVAIGPLVVDLLAYVTAGQLIVSSVTARRSGSKSVGTTASITLWLDANASTVVLAMAVGVDARFVGWTLDGYYSAGSPRTHAMQFGPGHWS